MPAYLFYFFQPLDINYFNLIKKMYDIKIEYLVRIYIIYITKENFFSIFKKVFNAIIIELNIKENFREVDFVLINFKIYFLN